MLEFNATFLIAMFSFVVFIFIMNAIFYNPILRIIRQREDYVNSNYEDAKRFDASAKEFTDTRSAKLEQTQKECRHDIRQIVSVAHSKANDKISVARENTKNIIREKKEALMNVGDNLKATVKDTVVRDLASKITSKLLGQDVSLNDFDSETINKVMD